MELFVVLRKSGPNWVAGKSARQQPYWDEHAEFIDRIFEAGKIMLGGPFDDGSGAMLIVRTATVQEAATIFAGDPWVLHDIMDQGEVKPWQMFLNAFQNPS
jgi:uncharacterized protein YciI